MFADIQEFYELTLLDETKSTQQKTAETLQIASKWEQEGNNTLRILEVSDYFFDFSFHFLFLLLCII